MVAGSLRKQQTGSSFPRRQASIGQGDESGVKMAAAAENNERSSSEEEATTLL